jgi:hypothetical protein
MVKTIELTQGKSAIVSNKDYQTLQKYKWHAHKDKHAKTYYALRAGNPKFGEPRRMGMHTMILGMPLIDHKNGNGLDNRRSNLRQATFSQNSHNHKIRTNNKSGYKGVNWNSVSNKWMARISVNYKRVYLGTFELAKDAHAAYAAATQRYFGKFAKP